MAEASIASPAPPSPVLKKGWIGVVTVTYNSADVLPEFLASLAAQSCKEFTLYVVDNASRDVSLEICRRKTSVPTVVTANDSNLGVAEANNQGIRAALTDGCEYVLLLNNDTVFDARLLADLRDGLVRHNCSMVVPKILYHDPPAKIWAAGGRFQPWAGYRAMHYGDGERDRGQFDKVRTITYAPTCCVLIDRIVFEQIGLMDPKYFVYFDDTDFMYRAMKAGVTSIYLPSCTLLHKVASLSGGIGSSFAHRYGTRNRIYFLRKHLSRFWATVWIWTFWSFLYLRYLLRCDSRTTWATRRNAITEGLRMSRSDRQLSGAAGVER